MTSKPNPKLKPLNLTLKKKWFDLIASGKKTEEYREIKPYWTIRLIDPKTTEFKEFSEIIFKNGYSRDAPVMRVEFKGIKFGEFEGKKVYVIKLGKIFG